MLRTQAGAPAAAKRGSELEDQLVIMPEWVRGGYIQIQLESLGFNTIADTGDSKPAHYHWGAGGRGFDLREGSTC